MLIIFANVAQDIKVTTNDIGELNNLTKGKKTFLRNRLLFSS
jgi:hypothetical protein